MERMEEVEQKEVLLMSEYIKYFIERKQKRHQKEFIILGKQTNKRVLDNAFSFLFQFCFRQT